VAGRIAIDQQFAPSITYHDPCYLGRWNGLYDTPRRLLDRMSRDGVRELGRHREHSFCCGAGGGRMFMEEKAPRVNRNRTDEILALGVETAAVACPFCTIMITDGTKEADVEDKLKVVELSELLWRTMTKPAAKASTGPGNEPAADAPPADA
jgi:Fe-S oxidoreductase